MSQRKTWTLYEDSVLKNLREAKKIKKWTEISEIMSKDYGINERTGKQCRERYENHLKGDIDKGPWTESQEIELLNLHLQHGNKWVYISDQIKQYGNFRTGNNVKNYFMSLMKRALKNFNQVLLSTKQTYYRTLPYSFISKLLRVQTETRDENSEEEIKKFTICKKIESELILYRAEIPKEQKVEQAKQLFEKIKQLKKMLRKPRNANKSRQGALDFQQNSVKESEIPISENENCILKTRETHDLLQIILPSCSFYNIVNNQSKDFESELKGGTDQIFFKSENEQESEDDQIERCFLEIEDFFCKVNKCN